VAKINPIKVKQDADKLEKAGKVDQAIALYRQLVEDNPRDWNTIKKIGDLFVRLNRNKEAIGEYSKVAEFYARDGFLLKAIAIWKQINKLDPATLEPYLNLADLYAKQGLMMEAKGQYQVVVDEYIKRGKMRDAGDVLKKMADVDPGDLKIRSKLADLYTREGNAPRAVEEHCAIAEELYRKGHLAEALQVLEKGLKIDPRSTRLRGELARIHVVQRNHEKAAHYLEEAVQQQPNDTQLLARLGEAYLGGKKLEEAEAIFRRLLELDPANQESRVQIGRLHILQGEFDQAFEQLAPMAEELLEAKEGDKAAALLQPIVQKEPAHVATLAKLAEIYTRLEKDAAVVSSYSQLTEAYIKRGQMQEAASVLERLLVLEPQNQQHKTKLQFVRAKLKPGAAPAAPAPPVSPASKAASPAAPEIEEEEFDLAPVEEAPAFESGPALAHPPEARPTIELSGPLTAEDKEFVEEHLAEGRVFRKYGLIDKAADQFEAVVARFADNAEARQELCDILKEKGQNAQAAEQCLALAEIHRLKGDAEQAEAFEREARGLAPRPPAAAPARPAPAPAEAKRPPARPAPAPDPPPLAEQVVEEAKGDEEEEEEEEEISFGEEEVPVLVEEGGLEPESAEPPAAPEFSTFDLDAEVGGELPSQFIEDEPAPALEAEAAPVLPEEAPSFPLDEEPAPEPSAEEFPLDEAPPVAAAPPPAAAASRPAPAPPRAATPPPRVEAPPSRPTPPPARPAAAAAAPAASAEVQRILEEVDSYVSLGFVDDAREALAEAAARFPGHAAIQAKLAELGMEAAEAVAEAPAQEALVESESIEEAPVPVLEDQSPLEGLDVPLPEPEPLEAGGVDLGAELGELFGAQAAVEEASAPPAGTDLGDAGLADIFKEFKKGVDKQLGKEDYDTRYNLGIAYKEMGLVDEAIAEFQLAAKDESRVLECSSMLGICFLEKGMPKLAIKWFEKGLKAPGRSEEEYQGLRYDLAMAYEADGEVDQALALYMELYGQDANFRDVAAKVRELKAAVQ
jgi:tetratricopeptide (TPR) repeat protein